MRYWLAWAWWAFVVVSIMIGLPLLVYSAGQ